MTTQSPTRSRSVWKETRVVTPKLTPTVRTTRPAQTEAPQSTAQAQSEQEAERWVAEMMFDHYNG